MSALPHVREIFERLARGTHLSPDDEPSFSALSANFADYADYFAPLGFELTRHKREFFYFAPDDPEKVPETLPRIAVFSYILIDHTANQGELIEELSWAGIFLSPPCRISHWRDTRRCFGKWMCMTPRI